MTMPTAAPAFSRRQILQSVAAVAASSFLSGCGVSLYRTVASTKSTQPSPAQPSPTLPPTSATISNPQPLPIGAITAASLTVASDTAGSFSSNFVGLAYQKQTLSTPLFTASNTDLLGLFKRLGSGMLSIGGTSVDHNVWASDGPGQTPGQTSPADIDALASFLHATGWTCLYGINLGGSANGSTTPALAAAEAAYVSQALGGSLAGIELGNECERYGDPGSFYAGNWTLSAFESLWLQFRDAILASTPGATLTGPAAGSHVDGWVIPFGEYVRNEKINLLTQHYDRGPAPTATVDDLLSPDPALTSNLLQLRYGAQSIDVPFRITACSAYANGGLAGVSDTYASALWAIDMIFQSAQGSAAGVNFQAGSAAPCTPIADTHGTTLAAQPAFYGLLFATLAGPGDLLSTQLSAASLNATSYAVQHTDGGMSLVIVNKDATQNLDLHIALPSSMTSAMLQTLTQRSSGATTPTLTARTGVTIQGAAVACDGTFKPDAAYVLPVTGAQLSCYVPALSAVILQLS